MPAKPAPAPQKPPAPVTPIARTAEGLRNMLFEEIDKLRAGDGDRRRALAISQLVQQVVAVTKVEIEYQRQVGLSGQTDGHGTKGLGVLRLGSDT